jgi:hypothetical protein
MPTVVVNESELAVGDYYENCSYVPCLCIRIRTDEVTGISIVDGSNPHLCSIEFCGVRKLSFAEAMHWKFYGPLDLFVPQDKRWWSDLDSEVSKIWLPRMDIPDSAQSADRLAVTYLRNLKVAGYFDSNEFDPRLFEEPFNQLYGFGREARGSRSRCHDFTMELLSRGWIRFRQDDTPNVDVRDRAYQWRIDLTASGSAAIIGT